MNEYSGKSSSQIVHELEESRQKLHNKLDRLNRQLQPDQIWETAKSAVTSSAGSEFTRNLGRSVRDNPLPVALIGAGIAWMIAGQGRRSATTSGYAEYPASSGSVSGHVSYDAQTARDDESNGDTVRDRVRETGQRVGQSLTSATNNARDRVSSTADAARHRLSDAQTRSQQAMADASDKIRKSYCANPVVFGLGIAAAAAVIGTLLPGTRREEEMLGSYADQARKQARKAVDTALDKASDVAEKTVETARKEAKKRGYDADSADAAASKAVEDATDIAKESAKTAKKETKAAAEETGKTKDKKAETSGSDR